MILGCISSKRVGILAFIENDIYAKQYPNILKLNLWRSAVKFGFITNNMPHFKLNQENDAKYNVMDERAKHPDLPPFKKF